MVRQPRGNALLVGVGGTGKQSLTRLAAHMCGYKCFQIELTRGYNYESFHEDLKKLYIMTGVKDENTVFLFTDTQVWPSWVLQKAAMVFQPVFSLSDCSGRISGGHQQHAELWRGP